MPASLKFQCGRRRLRRHLAVHGQSDRHSLMRVSSVTLTGFARSRLAPVDPERQRRQQHFRCRLGAAILGRDAGIARDGIHAARLAPGGPAWDSQRSPAELRAATQADAPAQVLRRPVRRLAEAIRRGDEFEQIRTEPSGSSQAATLTPVSDSESHARLPLREIERGSAQQSTRGIVIQVDVCILGPHGQIGQRDLGHVQPCRSSASLQRKLVSRAHIDLARS